MIAFWAVAGVLAAVAAGLVLLRAARAASAPEAADPTPILYRRQLTEIDDLAERGLIAEGERRIAHAEAARRLLAAAERPGRTWTSGPAGRAGLLAAVVLAPALALGLYLGLGAPGVPDQPFAQRLAEWRRSDLEHLQAPELAAVLQSLLKERPNDPELLRYVGIAEGAAQNPAEAVRALRRAVEIAPQRADLWTTLGEALVFRDGDVTPEAETAFRRSLEIDPTGISARFHLGRAMVARGEREAGIAAWRKLLADMPPDDPRRGVLMQAIAEAEAQPEVPSVAGDQLAAIQGMVARLADRLESKPDDPEGWVRLVRAYAVLGETAKRDQALKTAQARYAARPDVLDQLAQAAAAEPMR